MSKLNPGLVGVSGEYYVAAELSRLGYIASITLRNTKGVDILCSNLDATKTVGIQVKTNSDSKRKWILNQKVEYFTSDNLFYVFVNLNSNLSPPDFFVVPSKVVADICRKNHSNWLKTLGKKEQNHKDNPIRNFNISYDDEYMNRWDLLNL
jgi:hypothetical protein